MKYTKAAAVIAGVVLAVGGAASTAAADPGGHERHIPLLGDCSIGTIASMSMSKGFFDAEFESDKSGTEAEVSGRGKHAELCVGSGWGGPWGNR